MSILFIPPDQYALVCPSRNATNVPTGGEVGQKMHERVYDPRDSNCNSNWDGGDPSVLFNSS